MCPSLCDCEVCVNVKRIHEAHSNRRKIEALKRLLRIESRPEIAKSVRAQIIFLQAR